MVVGLGWPEASSGWAALVHPEWGQFQSGLPNPEHSNSGIRSLVSEVYSAAGLTEGLAVDVLKSPEVVDSVGAVQQRVFHYRKKDTDILERMTQLGPECLHAVTSHGAMVLCQRSR